jgi:hypothetical protein
MPVDDNNSPRPEGARHLHARLDLSTLPWEFWSLIFDSARVSSQTGSLVSVSKTPGENGFIRFKTKDSSVSWDVHTSQFVEMELLELNVSDGPWHSNPDVPQDISITTDDQTNIVMSGFDRARSYDGAFFTVCQWLWTFVSRIGQQLGGDTDKCVHLHTGIDCWMEYDAPPDHIREMILNPEKSVCWLADEVVTDTREGGRFWLRWKRGWGELALTGVLKVFKVGHLMVQMKDNPFGDNIPLRVQFFIEQIEAERVRLRIAVDGIPYISTSSFSNLLLSDLIQQALIGLSLILKKTQADNK